MGDEAAPRRAGWQGISAGSTDAFYRSLLEQVPAIVYVVSNDADPETLYVSPQSGSILGRAPEEYVADRHLWLQAILPEDRDRVLHAWRTAVAGRRPFEAEFRCSKPDGTTVWVRDRCVLVSGDDDEPLFRQGMIADITASKRAEGELRASEQRYRFLVENIPAVVYVVAPDDDRRTLYVSPHVERALGYTRREWLEQPDIWMELLHPDDRERTLAAHDRHNQTGEPWSREYRLIASDGRAVWFRDVATLVRDDAGYPQHWLGVQLDVTELKHVEGELRTARDELERRVQERTAALAEANELMSLEIGERRRAEAELRATEERYRLLAEHIPAVTYIWQRDDGGAGRPRSYTSPRIEQIVGYTPQEWHAKDFWISRLHPDDRVAVLAAMIRCEATGEPFSMEYRLLHKHGHVVWVLDEAELLTRDADGRPELFQGVMLDVTARKAAEARASEIDRAERERLDAETRYRALVEQMPAAVYVEEPTREDPARTRFTYLGPQTERILGVPPAELIEEPGRFERMIHPDDREHVLAANARRDGTLEPFSEEFRVVRNDGTVVWLECRASLIRDERGEPMFWHGIAMDVTAQRRTEASLRELQERYRILAGRVMRRDEPR